MSDVIVTTTNSVTDVTTTDDVTNINITETVVEVSASTAGVQGVPGVNSDPIYVIVTNKTGVTLAKGAIVYTSGANGTHTQVSLANASSDATSARTLGWVVSDILNNADGLVCVEGYIDGINTQGITEGAQLYLSGTVSGGFTETKPQAPTHLVYVGVCSKASAGNGRVLVKVQNGYELDELHNVKIVSPQNNDLLQYVSGTALWENVASSAVSVGSATNAGTATYAVTAGTATYATNSGTATYATTSGTAVSISGSITRSQVSDFTSGTVASASTAQQAGTAVYANTSGTSVYAETSGTSVYATTSGTAVFADNASTATYAVTAGTSVYATTSGTSVYADTSGTSVYAKNAGTSVYADTSGTATYATTSGTAVSISGTITRSQVSDYASGTVANISGTVTQSQVSGLATALAGKAGLADNNTFSGLNTFSNFTTFQAAADTIPIRVFGASGQSADLFSVNDYLTNTQFEILSDGRAQSLKGIIATVSSTASTPLVVRGTAGQSANLSEWQTSTGSTATYLTSTGSLVLNVGGTAGLLQVNSTATSSYAGMRFQSGDGLRFDLGKNDASNQSGSIFFYTSSTVPVEFSNANTRRMVIETNGNINIGNLAGSALALGKLTVFNTAATAVGQVIRGATSQSAALQQWQNSGGTTTSQISADGTLFASRFAYFGSVQTAGLSNAVVSVVPTSATNIPVAIRGAASQSADLQQWQDSTGGTPLAVSSTYGLVGRNAGTVSFALSSQNGLGAFYLQSASQVGLIVRGAASQSANLTEWQTSTGATALSVNSAGLVVATRNITIAETNAGEKALVVRGATAHTGNLLEMQTVDGTLQTAFSSIGYLQLGAGTNPGGQLGIPLGAAANRGIVVRGAASQSADYLQIQDSSGGTVAKIGSTGDVTAPAFRTTNDYVVTGQLNNGGSIRMQKADSVGAPPSNQVRLMVLAGTNANTLKLVAVGPNGSAVTILDNLA